MDSCFTVICIIQLVNLYLNKIIINLVEFINIMTLHVNYKDSVHMRLTSECVEPNTRDTEFVSM
ncbi:hypothetical protein BAC7755_56430 [Bacillus sp. MN7755]